MRQLAAGRVALVGAGPGDPKLITLRGKELLEEADTIIYDYLANPKLLQSARAEAEKIYVGKKGGARSPLHQAEINQMMISAASAGKRVVRLKGGDPFIFGRGGEEVEALVAAGIPFEVVPGVTSAISCPAYAGIPLTHREIASSVLLVTGHEDPEKEGNAIDLKRLATGADTLVFLMAMGNLSAITEQLIRSGKSPSTPIALIQWGTHPHQRTLVGQLDNLPEKAAAAGMKPPAVIVVGEVVSLRGQLGWFESRPLFGRRILVTRAEEQAEEFSDLLETLGAQTVSFSTLKIVPPANWDTLDRAIDQIESYDGLIFTSANGVRFFRERVKTRGLDLRILKGLEITAMGPRTAKEIETWGIRVDLIPDEFQAEGVVSALANKGIAGKRFLLPRAKEARGLLPEEIQRRGGVIDVVVAYEAVKPRYTAQEIEALLGGSRIDMVTFGSSSTLNNFMEIVGKERLTSSPIACIGPITAKTAGDFGLKVAVIPKESTFPALAEAIADYFGHSPGQST